MSTRLLWIPLMFLSAFTFSQSYDSKTIPAALKSRSSAVIRESSTTLDIRTAENVIVTVKKAITVLNKNGDRQASLFLYYDKSTGIRYAKGSIYDASGNLNGKFSLSDFNDESAVSGFSVFEDDRVKKYHPGSTAYPYTVVYEYEIYSKQNLVLPDWQPCPAPEVSVENSSFTLISKPGDEVRIAEYNFKGTRDESASEKLHSRTWRASNLPAARHEPYSPPADDSLPRVKVAATRFSYYGYKGSYHNWEELGKWIYDDLLKSQQTLSPAVIAGVRKMTDDLPDDREKVKKLYQYLQKKTRYVSIQIGIGGYRPFPAMDVERLSYGDCKALVNYMQSLLNAVGIESSYCIVNAGNYKKNLDQQFASMDQANHVILCVPLQKDTVWLECTNQNSPFGHLGSFTDDRNVLACTPQGGKLLKTPTLYRSENLQKRNAVLALDKDGNIKGHIETAMYGAQYNNYSHFMGEPYEEQLKLLKKEYDIDNIDFSSFKLLQKKEGKPVTEETLDLTIQKYAPKSGNLVYLMPNAFNKASAIAEVKNRINPVYVNRGYVDEDEVIYELPQGYKIEAQDTGQSIKSDYGSYTFNIVLDGDKLVYRRRLELNSGTYPPDKYAELVVFFDKVQEYDNTKVVLRAD